MTVQFDIRIIVREHFEQILHNFLYLLIASGIGLSPAAPALCIRLKVHRNDVARPVDRPDISCLGPDMLNVEMPVIILCREFADGPFGTVAVRQGIQHHFRRLVFVEVGR